MGLYITILKCLVVLSESTWDFSCLVDLKKIRSELISNNFKFSSWLMSIGVQFAYKLSFFGSWLSGHECLCPHFECISKLPTFTSCFGCYILKRARKETKYFLKKTQLMKSKCVRWLCYEHTGKHYIDAYTWYQKVCMYMWQLKELQLVVLIHMKDFLFELQTILAYDGRAHFTSPKCMSIV